MGIIMLENILNLYNLSGVKSSEIIDSSREEDDMRSTILVEYNNGEKLAVKLTNNVFTTPKRIKGWRELINKYLENGIYAPRIVEGLDGKFYYTVKADSIDLETINGLKNKNQIFIVYAEEQKKYKCIDQFNDKINMNMYDAKIFETIGIIGNSNMELVPWNSAYCLYDKFSEDDLCDENYECAFDFCRLFKENSKGLMIR